jgi:hypothetical protein
MNAMCPTDHDRVAMSSRRRNELTDEFIDSNQQQICSITQCPTQGRIDNISGGQPVVNPWASGATNSVLHDINKGGDIVLCDLFAGHHRSNKIIIDNWS